MLTPPFTPTFALLAVVAITATLPVPSAAQGRSADAVVLRDAPIVLVPEPNRTPLHIAPAGAKLTAFETEGAWVRVQFEDPRYGTRNGYIESQFVRIERPVSAPRPTAPVSAPRATVADAPSEAAARPPPPAVDASASTQALTFRKVDYAQLQGDRERSRSARMVLNPAARTLTFADEGGGEAKAVYAVIPYDAITKMVYEQSAHRRYGAGVLVSPLLFFTKGKKHWLTIEFQNVAALPQGFVYARLDKDNYRQILSALRAGTGKPVEEHIEK